jgi:uncharacterized protein YndB with AHSA1/START domain
MIALNVDDAFALFALRLDTWWPREYTWSRDVLQAIGIQPRIGGLCYEIGPGEFHCDWGRVLAWDPPHHLTLAWQISPRREPVPDPAHASRVDISFSPLDADRTSVELTHSDFAHHGDDAEKYREAMASEQGWPYILGRFAEAASGAPKGGVERAR